MTKQFFLHIVNLFLQAFVDLLLTLQLFLKSAVFTPFLSIGVIVVDLANIVDVVVVFFIVVSCLCM